MLCVCVEGRQCKKGSVCSQEGWQGEEPYLESDKSNVHVRSCKTNKQTHMYISAQYEYDINTTPGPSLEKHFILYLLGYS